MAKPTSDKVRKLFTEIGCIMEDASLIALFCETENGLEVKARYQALSDAHEKIGELLSKIDDEN